MNEENDMNPILRNNKAVMEALAAAALTSVTVVFDGYGDNGQIDSIVAHSGEVTVELPVTPVMIVDSDCEESTASEREAPLAEAIETVCFGYLEEKSGGWEVNEGSFGTFTFTVEDCSIDLDFNRRVIEVENSSQRF